MAIAKNIDFYTNKASCDIVEMLKMSDTSLSIIDKALGVSANDGVYGYYVYCKERASKQLGNKIEETSIFKALVSGIVDEFGGFVGKEWDKGKKNIENYD